MNHNTFDIYQDGSEFVAKSHNFENITGRGDTETEAIRKMNRAIIHYADNYPKEFRQNVLTRIKNNLYCNCGVKMESQGIMCVRIQ